MIFDIREIKEKIEPIAKKYDLSKVYLCGSYAKGSATKDSDLDFCIDYKDGKHFGIYKYIAFCDDLENVFNKHIDVIASTYENQDPEFYRNYNQSRSVVYG